MWYDLGGIERKGMAVRVTAIIPARYGSTRMAGKPLARETGKYLIEHVCERVGEARGIDRTIVATDDARIAEAVGSFGGEAVMTRGDHATGTDRIAEVVRGIGGDDGDVILNVQGDEPEVEPGALEALVARMRGDAGLPMATLACPFSPESDPADVNCVKVVRNRAGDALYFSRSLVPYARDAGVDRARWLLHIGVYAYRRSFLLAYSGWEPSALEGMERLEQLRVLDRGHRIAVELVGSAPPGIDTPADYAAFVLRHGGVAGS